MYFKRFFLFTCLIFPSLQVLSYPYYSGFGYNKCATCHYNPQGGGLVNDYGKSVYKVSLSNTFLAEPDSELKAQKSSIRPSLKLRAIQYLKNFNQENLKEQKFIPMQASFGVAYAKSGSAFSVTSITSYQPVPEEKGVPNKEYDKYRMRELLLNYKHKKNLQVSVGLQDKPYGLRVADHTSFARSLTNNSYNDQSYGSVLTYMWKKSSLTGGYFLGNLVQDEELRQRGFSLKHKYHFTKSFSSAISFWKSSSKIVEEINYSLDFNMGDKEGSSILGEFGQARKNALTNSEYIQDYFLYLAARTMIFKGNFIRLGAQVRKNAISDEYSFKYSIGYQFFHTLNTEFEARVDIRKGYDKLTTSPEYWDALFLYHFWI